MRLRDIEVSSFRGLKGPVRATFAEGLNVVHGMNETGKTTLLDAVRCALTLKAKISGAPFDRIEPRAGGTPSVVLTFEHAGTTWRLEKTWTGNIKGTTRLVSQHDGRTVAEHKGDEAEDKLRDLLGLADPGRGERKDEHLGLWPLLWVEQGASGNAPGDGFNDASRQSLSQRLSALSGVVLGGGIGDAVLRRAEDEEAKFWTSKGLTTKESAPLVVAQGKRDAALAACEALRATAARVEQDEADLGTVDDDLRSLEQQLPELDGAIAKAQESAAAAERLASEAAQAAEVARRLDSDAKAAGLVLSVRASRIAARDAARRTKSDVEQKEADLRSRAGAAAAARDAARGKATDARAAADRAESDSRRLRDAVAWTEARASHRAAAAVLAQARDLEESVRKLTAAQDADKCTAAWGRRLEGLADAATEARLKLEAAAARVEITALGAPLRVASGQRIDALGAGEALGLDLVETWEAVIGEVARVRVRPGGEELGSLRGASAEASRRLAKALAEVSCADVAAARRAVERNSDRAGDLSRHEKELARVAPDGTAELAAAAAKTEARVAELGVRLGLSDGDDAVPGLPSSLDELRAALEQAEMREQNARSAHDDASRRLASLDTVAAGLMGEHRGAVVELERCDDDIAAREASLSEHVAEAGDDAALEQRLNDAQRAARDARETADEAQRAAGAPGVATAPERLERARRARRQAETQMNDLKQRRAVLVDRLAAASGVGLSERLAAAEAEADVASRRHAALEKHAHAARRLAEALRSARQELEQRFHEPLRRQVEPLLAMLFPEARADFGEGFDLKSLQRGHETDAFEQLSGGAREQVAVIVRLGLARVLAGEERLLVMLDEPLNDTDRHRLQAMHGVLARCADKLQVIVSTSQIERWRGLAADQLIDLMALKVAAR